MAKTKAKPKTKGGLSVKTFSGGLNKKRMEQKGGGAGYGNKMILKKGEAQVGQFPGLPDDEKYFKEFDQHSFQEDGRWYYVPCAGDDCPLCLDESEAKSKVSYRFVCVVYSLKEKKLRVLEGPKSLASLIYYKFQQKPEAFLKRTFELIKFPTEPVTYGVDRGDDDALKAKDLPKEVPDLDAYIQGELDRYYGDESKGKKLPKKSALDEGGKKDKKSKGKTKDEPKGKSKKSKSKK